MIAKILIDAILILPIQMLWFATALLSGRALFDRFGTVGIALLGLGFVLVNVVPGLACIRLVKGSWTGVWQYLRGAQGGNDDPTPYLVPLIWAIPLSQMLATALFRLTVGSMP